MRSINKYTGKLIISGLALCLSMTNAFANTLSEIEVYQKGTGYGITLKTDSVAQMKKTVSSSDRMSIVLKDVNVSQNLNTVYNNVAKMDNITVQPAGKNDIKINFKGKGISNSNVSFASSANVSAYPETKSIQLNAPVSSYAPVYNPEKFIVEEEASQTANPELNEVLTKLHISREMLLTAKRYTKSAINKTKSFAHSIMDGNINMLTMFGMLMVCAMLVIRPRKDKKQSKKQPSTGISGLQSRANIEREIEINRQLAGNMNLKSSINNNYGVKAYQQSQRNPYTTAMQGVNAQSSGISGISRRRNASSPIGTPIEPKTISQKTVPLQNTLPMNKKQTAGTSVLPKLPKVSENMAKVSTPITRPSIASMPAMKQSSANSNQAEIDSMKFLESITKIYENSGRTDLAKGLKDNLRKAQMSKAV